MRHVMLSEVFVIDRLVRYGSRIRIPMCGMCSSFISSYCQLASSPARGMLSRFGPAYALLLAGPGEDRFGVEPRGDAARGDDLPRGESPRALLRADALPLAIDAKDGVLRWGGVGLTEDVDAAAAGPAAPALANVASTAAANASCASSTAAGEAAAPTARAAALATDGSKMVENMSGSGSLISAGRLPPVAAVLLVDGVQLATD